MTAKQGLLSLLTETTAYDDKLYSDALSFARQQKMSRAAVVKILDMVEEDSGVELGVERGSTVEEVVHQLADLIRTQRTNTTEKGENNHASLIACSDQAKKEGQDLETGVYDNRMTTNGDGDDASAGNNMVCVPTTLLNSLIEKVDALATLVNQQKEYILDVETRLKQELKLRGNRLVESIEKMCEHTEESLEWKHSGAQKPDPKPKVTLSNDKNNGKPNKIKNISRPKFSEKKQFEDVASEPSQTCIATAKPVNGRRTVPVPPTCTIGSTPNVPPNTMNPDETETSAYASSIDKIQEDEAGPEEGKWQRVTRRRLEPKPALGRFLGAKRVRKAVFYLGGVDPNCTSEDLANFCKEKCRIMECRMMPSRRAGTIAARIVVEMEHAEKLHTVEWPEYVYLRPWSFDQTANIV